MREILATVTERGQVTVPAEVRRFMGVKAGDKVVFVIDEAEGEVMLKAPRYPDVASLRGVAGSLPKPISREQMLQIAREDTLESAHRRRS